MRSALPFLLSLPFVLLGCTSAAVLCDEGSSAAECSGRLNPPDAARDAGDAATDVATDSTTDTPSRDALPDIVIESGPDSDSGVEEGPVEATPEDACDGADNDGDGRADEGFVLGAACSITQNGCVGTGAIVCDSEDPSLTRCGGELGSPEVCNGIDDDCDLVIDETFDVGSSCTIRDGECSTSGTQQCLTEAETACVAAGEPTGPDELCNDVDDDCDGRVDETFDVGVGCMSGACFGAIGCTESGTAECMTAGVPESCDGQDNDCDGDIDEDVVARCDSPGCETDSTAACLGGRLVCSGGAASEAEACDALDSDCDGSLDERGDGEACERSAGQPECYPFERLGSQYLFCFSANWDRARRHCEELGYKLTRINSRDENDALEDILDPIPGVDRFWLGARATGGGPTMTWLDGTLVSSAYTNYGGSEPNGSEQCLRMEFERWEPGEWGDIACWNPLPFVCEYEAP